jgi:hypothetical protein
MQAVYADWAEAMQPLSLGAINFGIEQAKKEAHPPSQGEFVKHCADYNPNQNVLKLESKLSDEQIAANKERIAALAKQYATKAAA